MNTKMIQHVLCMFVCMFTLSMANQVIEHVLLSDVKTRNGIVYSYTNKNETGSADEKWISELVGGRKSFRRKTKLEKKLKEYDDNDVIKRAEMDLDNPESEAAKKFSTLLLASAGPELQAANQLTGFVLRKVDTCPEKRYIFRYYWEKHLKRICKVVRPFHQRHIYVRCPNTKSCCKRAKFSACIPEGWVLRRVLVLCYDLHTNSNLRWKIVTRYFPQCCDCHYYA